MPQDMDYCKRIMVTMQGIGHQIPRQMETRILKGRKVLIVDPSEPMRKLVGEILHDMGCKDMREARDGKQALDVLRHFIADLVITEWVMEPMDGGEFLRHLRTSIFSPDRKIAVIVLTGHAGPAEVAEARDSGMTEFLAKPIAPRTLFERVASVLETPRDFVESTKYTGPDRRRRRSSDFSGQDRRGSRSSRKTD